MILTFFLFGLGEWIETNPGVAVTIAINAILGIIALARIEFTTRRLAKDVEDMDAQLSKHLGDKDAHVNQLYIGTLKDRIDRLETTVERGHKEIADKIDAKFEALANRMSTRK